MIVFAKEIFLDIGENLVWISTFMHYTGCQMIEIMPIIRSHSVYSYILHYVSITYGGKSSSKIHLSVYTLISTCVINLPFIEYSPHYFICLNNNTLIGSLHARDSSCWHNNMLIMSLHVRKYNLVTIKYQSKKRNSIVSFLC